MPLPLPLPKISRLQELDDQQESDKMAKAELDAQLAMLEACEKNYSEPSPVYDCVVFHDGTRWRAVVDTTEQGQLAGLPALADYREEQQHAIFTDADQMSYSVKIYEDGKILSIVTTSGSHGTHVAGILAAHNPGCPEKNGVAPGAQLVSIKIGDSRLDAMETGTGLVRGVSHCASCSPDIPDPLTRKPHPCDIPQLIATLENKCDLINMSFGEATTVPGLGLVCWAEYVNNPPQTSPPFQPPAASLNWPMRLCSSTTWSSWPVPATTGRR